MLTLKLGLNVELYTPTFIIYSDKQATLHTPS